MKSFGTFSTKEQDFLSSKADKYISVLTHSNDCEGQNHIAKKSISFFNQKQIMQSQKIHPDPDK